MKRPQASLLRTCFLKRRAFREAFGQGGQIGVLLAPCDFGKTEVEPAECAADGDISQ